MYAHDATSKWKFDRTRRLKKTFSIGDINEMISKYESLHLSFETVRKRIRGTLKLIEDYKSDRFKIFFSTEEASVFDDFNAFLITLLKIYDDLYGDLKLLKLTILLNTNSEGKKQVDESANTECIDKMEAFIRSVCRLTYPLLLSYDLEQKDVVDTYSILIDIIVKQQQKVSENEKDKDGIGIEHSDISYEFELSRRMTLILIGMPMHKVFLPLETLMKDNISDKEPKHYKNISSCNVEETTEEIIKKYLIVRLSKCGMLSPSLFKDEEDQDDRKPSLLKKTRDYNSTAGTENFYLSLNNVNEVHIVTDEINIGCTKNYEACQTWLNEAYVFMVFLMNRLEQFFHGTVFHPTDVEYVIDNTSEEVFSSSSSSLF